MMFLYENLVAHICPISEAGGLPVHNACFSYNILVLFMTGILVNGPYALITTAVSAELGTIPDLEFGMHRISCRTPDGPSGYSVRSDTAYPANV
jgi:hypothetical protein